MNPRSANSNNRCVKYNRARIQDNGWYRRGECRSKKVLCVKMDLLSLPECASVVVTTTKKMPLSPVPYTSSTSPTVVVAQPPEKSTSVLSCLSAAIPAVTDPALKMSTSFLNAVRIADQCCVPVCRCLCIRASGSYRDLVILSLFKRIPDKPTAVV